jgi:outer membrane lipoprotein SlyB
MRIAAIALRGAALNGGHREPIRRNHMSNTNIHASNEAPIRAGSSSFSRPAALIGGATALIALTAIATTIAVRSPSNDGAAESRGAAVAAQALASSGKASTAAANNKIEVNDDDADKPTAKEAPKEASKPVARPAPRVAAKPQQTPAAAEQHAAAAPAAPAACSSCGVIESVTPFQQKGEGSGIGAVAGGVVGGVIGNQMGGGNGKKAMTVLGAIGGGMAGHEIEKRQRSTTLYSVKVRMEDGTLRTVTQSTAPTVGQKVTVDGSQIKARA